VAYNITPLSAMGGVVGKQSLTDVISKERTPHTTWVQRLRLATDFITPDTTLICVADSPFHESVKEVNPLGLTQSFNWTEAPAAALVPEIGSRRKRAAVGSSQGGGASITTMLCVGESPLRVLTSYARASGINPEFWGEKDWTAMVGMNHDFIKNPIGIIVVEADPSGKNYSAFMLEQAVLQGQSRAYQAGQHLMVDNFNLIFEQVVPIWSIAQGIDGVVDYGTTI
jgi:hypothetical protein